MNGSEREYCIIYVPFPDAQQCEESGKALLHLKLVACFQLLSANSFFIWKGQQESAHEVILLVKTLKELKDEAIEKIQSLHPYEVPCIASWNAQVNESYYNWMVQELK